MSGHQSRFIQAEVRSALRAFVIRCTGAAVIATLLAGCGGSKPEQSAVSTAPKSASQSAEAKPAVKKPAAQDPVKSVAVTTQKAPTATPSDSSAVGKLTGMVSLTGTAPELALLVKQGDSAVRDTQVCGSHNIPDESLLVKRDAGNGVANVFIYLVKSPVKKSDSKPTEAIVLDQKGCQYIPHAAVVQVGQPVQFLSSDAVAHNVHTFPKRNNAFNQTVQANSRDGIKYQYESFEVEPIEIKCDIHPWMRAYQLVVDHPFAAVTDDGGHFEINNLPAGKYSFRIWHERGGLLEREFKVELQPGQTKEVPISFPAEKFSAIARQP